VRFEVRDTGPGIPRDKLAAVFQPFEQADASTTRKHGGTGLGLSISAQLVRLMGGRLEVESEVGRGSRFFFTLPMEAVAPRAEPPPAQEEQPPESMKAKPAPAARPLRVLVAEDSEINQIVTAHFLKKQGHQPVVVANGRLALEALAREPFDLVLMDVEMPEMDGFEATARLRAGEGGGRRLPIIGLTAHAMKGDRERCLAAGMDGYLTKPVEAQALASEIARVMTV
jgi:CheY-like chemotaxis protein